MLIFHLAVLLGFLLALARSTEAQVATSRAASSSSSSCASRREGSSLHNPNDPLLSRPIPFVNGRRYLVNGTVVGWPSDKETTVVFSPIVSSLTGQKVKIGEMAAMSVSDALEVLENAKSAWNHGQGVWPQMTLKQRIEAVRKVVKSLKDRREEIVEILMWEIGKTAEDAAAEFDRTMTFIDATIAAFIEMDQADGNWRVVNGIMAKVRRGAIGVMLCLGPFNYPFNETYAVLIPALLAGNIVIMKIPSIGGLAHILSLEAYAQHLPSGAINFISGSGRATMSPLMATGDVDVFAFIGGSKTADVLIKSHPFVHRLKVFLQLEGKNLGIILPDADLNTAVEQVVLGSLSYNGQRCTAIKLVMVHSSLADEFTSRLVEKVDELISGLPWEPKVKITPLPEPEKPKYLRTLIDDALAKGATVANDVCGGGSIDAGGTLMTPAVIFPVTASMKLWHEEQFGPVVPVAVYKDIKEVHDYIAKMPYGQQAAIFTSNPTESSSTSEASDLLDALSTVVGRINVNTQCGRSPDVFPFSGRRSSALGTMSVTEAIRAFSVEVLLAAKSNEGNSNILKHLESTSNFLSPVI